VPNARYAALARISPATQIAVMISLPLAHVERGIA
jgi:hypothetical protein